MRVCVFWLSLGEKMTLLASATLDEVYSGRCVLPTDSNTHTYTRKHIHTQAQGRLHVVIYERTCTEADCSGSLGRSVSWGVTTRQSPAGVAAGH